MPPVDRILFGPCTALKVIGHISKQLLYPSDHSFSFLQTLLLIPLHQPMHLPCMIRAASINLSLRSGCCCQLTEKTSFGLHQKSCCLGAGYGMEISQMFLLG